MRVRICARCGRKIAFQQTVGYYEVDGVVIGFCGVCRDLLSKALKDMVKQFYEGGPRSLSNSTNINQLNEIPE